MIYNPQQKIKYKISLNWKVEKQKEDMNLTIGFRTDAVDTIRTDPHTMQFNHKSCHLMRRFVFLSITKPKCLRIIKLLKGMGQEKIHCIHCII